MWLSHDTLETFDLNDLPTLDVGFLKDLPRIDGLDYISKDISTGRNDKLKAMCVAALNNFKSVEEVAKELLDFDLQSHNPPLFRDPREGNRGDPLKNALKFVASINKTIERSLPKITELVLDFDKTDDTEKSLPEPTGVLKTIRDYVSRNSIKDQPEFSLCTALHILSAFSCGRFELDGTHPILFSFVLGEPGSGKDDIVAQTKRILLHEKIRPYNLMGAGHYASSVALCQGLGEQRARLDVVDEASRLFSDSTKKEGHGSGVITTLNELYSSPGSFFNGPPRAATRKETYACESPFVNMIGLIQPKQFIQKVHSDHLDNGFLSRCLFFKSNVEAKVNESALCSNRTDGLDDVISHLQIMFPQTSILHKPVLNIGLPLPVELLKPTPKKVQKEPNLNLELNKLFHYYDARRLDFRDNDIAQSLLVRAFEKVKKIAIICAVSDWVGKGDVVMTKKHLEWATDLVDTQLLNNISIVEQATGPKGQALLSKEIETFISKKKLVPEYYIHNQFRKYDKKQRQDVLADLLQMGIIEKYVETRGSQNRPILKFVASSEDILTGSSKSNFSLNSLNLVSKSLDYKKQNENNNLS